MSDKEELCSFCKSIAKQKCSGCKIAYYCNREHQKLDWKSHSKVCRLFEIDEDQTIGRLMVAARNIEIDEVVLLENKPLLIVPNLLSRPVCLNCYVILNNTAVPCNNCGWPLCPKCTRHGPECALTKKYRKSKVDIFITETSNAAYSSVTVLRVLAMRQKNPTAYEKFMNLVDHCETLDDEMRNSIIHISRLIKNFLNIDDLNEGEIMRIIGIVGINGFGDVTAECNDCVVVFDKASYFSHNCRPNCRVIHFRDKSGARIEIRAVSTIPKGQPMTITYTDPRDGTAKRQKILSTSKFFKCICERCNDPTEFGTMLSAVKCFQNGCTGSMLPPRFIVSNGEKIPDFRCDKCNWTVSATKIDEIMEAISTDYSKRAELIKNNMKELKKFVDDNSKILHENNYLLIIAETELNLVFHRQDLKNVSNEVLQENINLCNKLISILEIVAPAEYAARGTTLYLKFTSMNVLHARQLESNDVSRFFKECKEMLTESYRLLRHEQKNEQTGQIATSILNHLETISTIEKLL